MENEIWKDVVGYEESYQVSDKGRVYSKGFDYLTSGINSHRCKINPDILKCLNSTNGYHNVALYKKGVKNRKYFVHRLVAIAFIPNLENKPHVNHKNGIRTDNRLENLEWCTAKENIVHSFEVLKREPNRKGFANVFQEKQVKKLNKEGELLEIYKSAAEAGRMNNINRRSIYAAIKQKCMAKGFRWERV